MSFEHHHERTTGKNSDAAEKLPTNAASTEDKMYSEINSIRRNSGSFSSKEAQLNRSSDLELSALAILSKYSSLANELGIKDSTRSTRLQNSDRQQAEDKETSDERQRMIAGAASLETRKEIEPKEDKKSEALVGAPPPKLEIIEIVAPVAFRSTEKRIENQARESKSQPAPAQFIPGRIENNADNKVIAPTQESVKAQDAAQKAKEEEQKKEAEKKQKEIDKLGAFGDRGLSPGKRSRRKKKKLRRRRGVRGRRRIARGGGRRRGRGRVRRRGRHRARGSRHGRSTRRNPERISPERNNPSDRQDRQAQRRAVAPPPPVQGDMAIKGAPTSTVEQIQQFLEQSNSPAAREQGFAKNLYDICTKRGLDPSVALGFFMVESTMGRHGRGHNNKSLGNIRGRSPESGQTDGQFRKYSTWTEGARDWARLIDEKYVHKRGHQTLSQVVRVYCPGSEASIRHYVSGVKGVVESFKRKNNGRSVA